MAGFWETMTPEQRQRAKERREEPNLWPPRPLGGKFAAALRGEDECDGRGCGFCWFEGCDKPPSAK